MVTEVGGTVYIVHTVLRGKNNPAMVGIKIEGCFNEKSKAETFAKSLASGEQIIQGELAELRIGITESRVE